MRNGQNHSFVIQQFPFICTIIFLILGITTGAWKIAWVIFLMVPLVSAYTATSQKKKKKQVKHEKDSKEDWEDF